MADSDYPVLYLFGRTDLASMNAGKMAAQTSHATYQFALKRAEYTQMMPPRHDILALFSLWERSTKQRFGTTITLACNEMQMKTAIMVATALGFVADITNDPTYPIVDGDVVHEIPLDTSGYIFGMRAMLRPIVGKFDLYR